jgi:hypothetical protein
MAAERMSECKVLHCINGLLAFRFYNSPRGVPMVQVAVGRQTRVMACKDFGPAAAGLTLIAYRKVFAANAKRAARQ